MSEWYSCTMYSVILLHQIEHPKLCNFVKKIECSLKFVECEEVWYKWHFTGYFFTF
jgi:hypothetical protein